MWNLLVFFFLAWVAHNAADQLKKGDLALMYLILYPTGRYLAELQRPDAWVWAGIPVAQIISVFLMLGASYILLKRHGTFRLLRERALA